MCCQEILVLFYFNIGRYFNLFVPCENSIVEGRNNKALEKAKGWNPEFKNSRDLNSSSFAFSKTMLPVKSRSLINRGMSSTVPEVKAEGTDTDVGRLVGLVVPK